MTKRQLARGSQRGNAPAIPANGQGKLRQILDAACAEHDFTLDDLTVLSAQVDPYRLDTPAGHRDGKWAADLLAQTYRPDKQAHLRGLHYAMIVSTKTFRKPDGKIYRNTDADWIWLSEIALKAARWLGYIPFDRFRDRRNAAPIIHRRPRMPSHAWVAAELSNIDVDDIEPKPRTAAFVTRQAFQFVIFGEKSSLEDVLLPLAEKREADLSGL